MSWELPIENIHVARVLKINFDLDPLASDSLQEEPVWRNGQPVRVCSESGRWHQIKLPTNPIASIGCPIGADHPLV